MTLARSIVLLMTCLGLAGCSALLVKSASDADDAKAKEFALNAADATVYVYRDDGFMGGDVTSNVYVNDKLVAEGARNRFNVLLLPPGHYVFSSGSNDSGAVPAAMHAGAKPPVEITAEPGHLYFVHQKWEGFKGFFTYAATREEAEPAIRKGKLIAVHQL